MSSSVMCLECSICFCDIENKNNKECVNLCCGHSFHKDCIKTWYLKGASGTSCPMCRKSIYFKHSIQILKSWVDERQITLMKDSWNTEIDSLFESYEEVFQELLDDKYSDDNHDIWETVAEDLWEDMLHYEEIFRDCEDPETFEEFVNDPLSYLVTEYCRLSSHNPHQKYIDNLFISKNSYGVVMSKM